MKNPVAGTRGRHPVTDSIPVRGVRRVPRTKSLLTGMIARLLCGRTNYSSSGNYNLKTAFPNRIFPVVLAFPVPLSTKLTLS
jgi:hypothetical protein